ncbi:hypothetical protein [Sphingomonas xanthus]|nr:hypothetical protein [Sphingomonas xanthus]
MDHYHHHFCVKRSCALFIADTTKAQCRAPPSPMSAPTCKPA